MPITLQAPQPGDLITASFAKQIVDLLTSLDQRVTVLEGATVGSDGALTITQISPNDVVVGDQIQISGANFGLPSEVVVSFDGTTSVTKFLPGSGDTTLILNVPPINFGKLTFKTVTVTVSGKNGNATGQITAHAAQATIPVGTITVSPGQIPANIAPGGDFVIPFNVAISANLNETYNLVPSVPVSTPAWNAVLVTNINGTTEVPKPWQIPIPKPTGGQPSTTTLFVKISIPLNTTVTAPFVRLDVVSQLNPTGPTALTGGFSAPIVFNQPQQPPQTLKFAINAFTGTNVSGDTNVVSLPLPTPTTPPIDSITYSIQGLKKGTYTLSLAWRDTALSNGGWTASFGGAPGIGNWPTLTKSLTMGAAGADSEKVALVGTSAATANTLIFTVRSDSDPTNDYGILNQGVKARS